MGRMFNVTECAILLVKGSLPRRTFLDNVLFHTCLCSPVLMHLAVSVGPSGAEVRVGGGARALCSGRREGRLLLLEDWAVEPSGKPTYSHLGGGLSGVGLGTSRGHGYRRDTCGTSGLD